MLIVAWREITSGESGCNCVTSSLLRSCSINPFRDILAVPLLLSSKVLNVANFSDGTGIYVAQICIKQIAIIIHRRKTIGSKLGYTFLVMELHRIIYVWWKERILNTKQLYFSHATPPIESIIKECWSSSKATLGLKKKWPTNTLKDAEGMEINKWYTGGNDPKHGI